MTDPYAAPATPAPQEEFVVHAGQHAIADATGAVAGYELLSGGR